MKRAALSRSVWLGVLAVGVALLDISLPFLGLPRWSAYTILGAGMLLICVGAIGFLRDQSISEAPHEDPDEVKAQRSVPGGVRIAGKRNQFYDNEVITDGFFVSGEDGRVYDNTIKPPVNDPPRKKGRRKQ